MSKAIPLLIGLSWLSLHIPILILTNSIVEEPYMDEPFHFAQAIEVHEHPISPKWDPKITTPSGLYYITLLMTFWTKPNLFILRSTSAVFNALTTAGISWLVRRRSKNIHESFVSSWFVALKIMTFPPLFFVGQLYYTDGGALFFVIAAWIALENYRIMESLGFAAVAIWFRQTNAVWTVFLGGMHFARRLNVALDDPQSLNPSEFLTAVFTSEKFKLVKTVRESIGFILVPAIYVTTTFIQSGGNFVHGDESNHQITVHGSQLCYSSAIFFLESGLAASVILSPKESIASLLRNWGAFALCVVVCFAMVYRFFVTHPFLLADNRHFSFYVWSKFFRRHEFAKYVPVPFYAVSLFFVVRQLYDRTKSTLVTVGFLVASMLSLVPLPLFEPRYFIVPLAVYCILVNETESKRNSDLTSALVILMNSIVNAGVASLFWFQPFQWPDGTIARFMW